VSMSTVRLFGPVMGTTTSYFLPKTVSLVNVAGRTGRASVLSQFAISV